MKLQLAILFLVFLAFGIVLYFTTPLKTGLFYKPLQTTTTTTTIIQPLKPAETEYNLTEAHVGLRVGVSKHFVVGMKNATFIDFGDLPPGSFAIGKIRVEVEKEVPVYCNVSGNISKLIQPKEFNITESSIVTFNVTLEDVKVGEIYVGSFDCYKPA